MNLRKKHDSSFPVKAIEYCLDEAGVKLGDVDSIIFYDKPILKFDRLLETYLSYAPQGLKSFMMAMPVWLKDKLFMKSNVRKELAKIAGVSEKEVQNIKFSEHHLSHAASAFYPSPFNKAADLCLDGVGEWATTTVWSGDKNELKLEWEINFPHSLGLLYSAFTYYTGFKVNSGEYKLMGLAPYGEPKYVNEILENLIDVKEDGTYRLNMKYFNFATGLTMTNDKFHKLFGGAPRKPESDISQKEMDIAASIQVVTEEIVLKLAKGIHKELDVDYLCLAGGVALNCVSNGRLLREGPFKNIWIQPASGDAGGALGAALALWYQEHSGERKSLNEERSSHEDFMKGSYLGPEFSNQEIKTYLDYNNIEYKLFEDEKVFKEVADILSKENVVGWFQGKMEFGPRALGNRSIIGDPRSAKMQTNMNLKIKYRESFRPFAPAVKFESVENYFQHQGVSPYMLMVAPISNDKRIELDEEQKKLFGIEKLKVKRSQLPAITHVDYSARVQTVHRETNSRFYNLLDSFEEKTGCPVLVNTSFNVRGEPIVTTPEDAYRCFMRTVMDYLVLGDFVLDKKKQKPIENDTSWKEEFVLD